ncbi:MAG: hypothetical protein FJX62_02405 [Alphaproteobacteria bacterium]|nr:hypothetical protein [Alphaproteobacteria bacterium]
MTAQRRIGILDTAAPDPARLALWELFEQRLRELGHASAGLRLEFRFAEGRKERLAPAAAELVALGAGALVTAGTPAADAAARTTRTIPIVMATGTALEADFAKSPDQRVDNLTGLTDLPPGLSEARLKLLMEALPQACAFSILADRGNPSSPPAVRETHEAGRRLGVATKDYWISGPGEFDSAFAAMRADGLSGFAVAPGAMFFAARTALAETALRHRLAAMTVRRDYCEAGALISYGAPIEDNYRRAAEYVDRILRGAKPSELELAPVSTFELFVNRATARALGLELPKELLARAHNAGG